MASIKRRPTNDPGEASACESTTTVAGFACPDGEIRCDRTDEHTDHFNRSHCRTGHWWITLSPQEAYEARCAELRAIRDEARLAYEQALVTWQQAAIDLIDFQNTQIQQHIHGMREEVGGE
ncbi:hypothetical protein [Nocardia otitidiscaviarum]|uniref:hypothetical protein n=1 Tax=Nocardia otitidiscaviarum TaxID=1823 RepID=UPI0004A6DB2B|nr:hypothetical protein [Nocardia otitidiscaviarum]